MRCFKCFKEFSDLNNLCLHFKHHHNLREIDLYICVEGNCNQKYSCFQRFKAHLRRHLNIKSVHNLTNTGTEEYRSQGNSGDHNIEYFDSNEDLDDIPSGSQNGIPQSSETSLKLSFEEMIASFEEKILGVCQRALTELHSKDNFCRKDV